MRNWILSLQISSDLTLLTANLPWNGIFMANSNSCELAKKYILTQANCVA